MKASATSKNEERFVAPLGKAKLRESLLKEGAMKAAQISEQIAAAGPAAEAASIGQIHSRLLL